MADACGPSLLPKERPSSSRCRSNPAATEPLTLTDRHRRDHARWLEGAKTDVILERAQQNAAACFSASESTVTADRHDLVDHILSPDGAPLSLRPRVLLAEDYPDMVKAVSRLLELDCEIVGSVADGSALLDAAQRLQPDVIVLDVNLSNVQSLEACREIRRVNPTTKVIMFTAIADPAASQAYLGAGASAFVSKLASEDLLPTIKRLCIDEG